MDNKELRIREAELKDLDAIVSMYVKLNQYLRPFSEGAMLAKNLPEILKAHLLHCMWDKKSRIIVADYEGKVIGYVFGMSRNHAPVYKETKYVYIESFYVEDKFRKHGIGNKLVKELSAWAHRIGAHELNLTSYLSNRSSLAAYKKMGFKDTRLILRLDV